MKILIIDNAAFCNQDGKLSIYKNTGEFGYELLKLGNNIEFFQISHKSHSSLNPFFLDDHPIKTTAIRGYKVKILTYSIAYIIGLWRVANNDFIYIFYPNNFKFLCFLCVILRKKYGLYIRGEIGFDSLLSNFLYKYSETVLTVSPTFSQKINTRLLTKRAFEIKPMIAFSEKDIVHGRQYNKNDNFRLLFLGRIEKDKGLFELLDAIKLIRENCSMNFILDVTGDGSMLRLIKKYAEKLGIKEIINFTEPITDALLLKDKYLQSDLFILPSYHEGFPRTIYEAMMFGTPIITTFVGGISSYMIEGYNCYRIEPKSVQSMYNKLIFAMVNYPKSKEITQNGKITISKILSSNLFSHAEQLNNIISNR